jgi:hypothetical protein
MSTSTDTATTEDQQPEPTPVPLPDVEWTDKDGIVHVGHPVFTECGNNCYQTEPATEPATAH